MTRPNIPIPANEQDRLNALLNYHVLDTFSEEEFDSITKLVAYICDVPTAFISLVDDKRQWFKSRIGLDDTEMPRDISFCQYTIMEQEIFEVPDAQLNQTFRNNPLVTGVPFIRFYAGAPLTTPEGFNIGALCVIDQVPRKLDEVQRMALSTLAKHVITQLELRNKNVELKSEVEKLSKKALETITSELNSYKLALDETSGVIISDAAGIIDFVNDETCRTSKYSREELIRKDSVIFDSGFHPASFFEDIWNTISSGSIWKNEIKNKAKDGTFYWSDTTIVPFLDNNGKPYQYVSIKRDITKQKQEESQLDQFFNLSLDYFCVANTNGFFEKVSPVFSRELGFSEEELLTQSLFDFIHEEDIESSIKELEKLGRGLSTINFEARFKCKGGGYKLLSWNASPDQEMGVFYATARDITNSKKINEENKRLSLVAKGTDNIVIITDKDRKMQWGNQAFETSTGYSLEEVIGKNPRTFLQYDETNLATSYAIREALNNKTAFKGEIKNRSKDGRKYWIDLNISPVFNDNDELINFIAIETDITEKKKKDLSIRNLLETQNSIFNGVGHAVMFTNASGIIQIINKAGLNLVGYTAEEVVGKMSLLNFHDAKEVLKRSQELSLELGEKVEPNFNTFIAKTTPENSNVDANEWTYVAKSGKRIPVWMSVTCIKNTEGTILGYFSAAEDYTIKKQAESDLINAKNLAEQAVYAKDSFLANMSHEIRTPLNAIIGFTELLAQRNLDAVQSEYVGNIQIAGDNLLLLINDILDLSKIESGQLVIESYPFNINNVLKHVYNLLKVKADQKGLEFILFLDANMPEFVIGDKGRLNQIIMNLAGNAVKFTESGEVTISVKKMVETDSTVTLRFSIKDTGIGITEEKSSTIFERFTQAEASTTRKFGGTGLGLNIVKQLVELQNGQISVKSRIGKGSEFYFSLEFLKAETAVADTYIKNSLDQKSLGNLSILLCEDNELNKRLAKIVIENFGFKLDIASNGQEGIDLLLKNKYDLILMDLQMPIKDGYQTTIYIRNELKMSIPIIAMTAHSLVGEQQKCFDIGMNAYVAKPFKQTELLDKIQLVLELKSEKAFVNPVVVENIPVEITEKKAIDLSYLDEIMGEDKNLKREMIELFIQNVPNDVNLLEKAVLEKDVIEIKKMAHHMKSSLAMFNLDNEVAFLEQTERNANASIISSEITEEFTLFKSKLVDTIEVLREIKIV
ncbi:MAG: PAS domain S-box protein [Bacteroidota bacterium]